MVNEEAGHAEHLEARVLAAVRPCLGRKLQTVSYGCLVDECTPEDLHDPDFYFGGELSLLFAGDQALILTWDENAGWGHHFSVQARSATAFRPNALRSLDGSGVLLWQDHLDHPLEGARVHGLETVPHAVELCFPAGSVLVGDGVEGRLGDGDDVIVRAGEHLSQLVDFDVLASISIDSPADRVSS